MVPPSSGPRTGPSCGPRRTIDMDEALFLGSVMSATVPAPKDKTLAAPNPCTTRSRKSAAKFAGTAAKRIFAEIYISSEMIYRGFRPPKSAKDPQKSGFHIPSAFLKTTELGPDWGLELYIRLHRLELHVQCAGKPPTAMAKTPINTDTVALMAVAEV